MTLPWKAMRQSLVCMSKSRREAMSLCVLHRMMHSRYRAAPHTGEGKKTLKSSLRGPKGLKV